MDSSRSSNSAQSPPPLYTSDSAAVAYARTKGFDNYTVVRIANDRAAFRFAEPTPSLLSTLAEYYEGRAVLNVADFDHMRGEVRRQIAEVLRGGAR